MSYVRRIAEAYSEQRLSADELALYARHLLLPGIGTAGQLKLKAAKVLVVGAGGLGCPVLQALAGAGVGRLTVLDPDVIDRSNLARQWLHRHEDLGRSKIDSAVEALRATNPHLEIEGSKESLVKANAYEFVSSHDIVVDATDDFDARQCIDTVCAELDRPWVHAALYRDRFQVSTFWARYGARYKDLFSDFGDAPDCATAGVFGATAAMAGNAQAWEVIKLITACEPVSLGELVSVHTPSFSVSKFQMPNVQHAQELVHEAVGHGQVWSLDRLHQALSIHEPVLVVDLDGSGGNLSSMDVTEVRRLDANQILDEPSLLPEDKLVCLVCESGLTSGLLASALNATARGKPVVALEFPES